MDNKKSLVGALEDLIDRVYAMDDAEIEAVAYAVTELEDIPLVHDARKASGEAA